MKSTPSRVDFGYLFKVTRCTPRGQRPTAPAHREPGSLVRRNGVWSGRELPGAMALGSRLERMVNVPKETLNGFIETCHRVVRHGLVRCSSGNLSLRVDETRMLVTASRSWLGQLSADDVSLCLISDGSLLEGGKPSVEIGIHAGILRSRPDVNLVMHFQTPCATALACQALGDIDYFVIPEIPFYIGPIARIPYVLPGSKELAQAVTDAMREHDLVVMGNHGQVTVASDADHAIQNAEFFELASEIILRSGDRVTSLPEEEAQTLLEFRRAGQAQRQGRTGHDAEGNRVSI